jgi:hypothetical protein
MSIENLGSGITHEDPVMMALRDYDDQIMVLDSISQVVITSVNASESTVAGFNNDVLDKGIAQFDAFQVRTEPGTSNVQVQASSKAIDTAKIAETFEGQISENIIDLSFRYCKPGEMSVGDVCSTCSPGTYSLQWNSTECIQCVNHAV